MYDVCHLCFGYTCILEMLFFGDTCILEILGDDIFQSTGHKR